MDIRFAIGSLYDNVSDKNVPLSKVMSFCGQGRPEGSAEGLIPLKLSSNVTVPAKVTIYSSTSTNRKGAVSAVVKVSIPYSALRLSDDGASVVGTDSARSGAELAMHTVLTLPASAVADLKGANGLTQTQNAERQVAVVVRLLSALLAQRLLDPGFAKNDGGAESTPTTSRVVVDPTAVAHGEAMDNSSLVPTDQLTGFIGNTGFDLTQYSPMRSLSEILTRIVAKQAPLGCADIVARSIVVQGDFID